MAALLIALVFAGSPAAPAERVNRSCETRACWQRIRERRRRSWARRHPWEHARNAIPSWGREWLRATRLCESGGRYDTNTGNGFSGSYQFTPGTWRAAGGSGLAHQASPAEQDVRAYSWMVAEGRGHWPACG